MRPLVASGEKPKAFFPLTEIMPFKFEYNSISTKFECSFSAILTALKQTKALSVLFFNLKLEATTVF